MASQKSGKCLDNVKHLLRVTFGLDHSLVIHFHHARWAEAFEKYVKERDYHKDLGTNVELRDYYNVHLLLPQSVRKVDVKENINKKEIGLWFMFDKEESALPWYENSKLWKMTSGKAPELFLPLEWQHREFDRLLNIETSIKPSQNVGPVKGSGKGSFIE